MGIENMVLPHRLVINRSLRKKAEELRDKIDNYAERYDAHYKKNTAELEAVKEKLDNEYEKAKEDAIRVISSASSELQELTNLISEYLTSFYNRKIFIKQIECNSIQQNIVKQYEHFLTLQMSEIGEEIDLLKKRIEILSGEADIQDILQLISLCGSAISIDNISSAQDLLDYISNLMSTSTENDSIQWYTLMNVRTMLEERVTFLDEIQFITWVIAQKIQLSKELKSIRNKQRTLLKKLQKEEKQLHDEKHSLDTVVTNTEHSIRFLFARKIVLLSVEIDTCYEEKDSRYSDLDSVKHDIDDMKTSHSHDTYKWDRLQRDHKSIYSDIESLKSEIEIKQSNRKKCHSRRNELFAIIQLRTRGKKDEQEFVHSRLQELQIIEADGMEAAMAVMKIELEQLKLEKTQEEEDAQRIQAEISGRLERAQADLDAASNILLVACNSARCALQQQAEKYSKTLKKLEDDYRTAKYNLERIKATDTRFILVRWLSDSPEEVKAKAAISTLALDIKKIREGLSKVEKAIEARDYSDYPEVTSAQLKVRNVKKALDSIKDELENAETTHKENQDAYERKIKTLRPHPERPTSAERMEMNKLKRWLEKQDAQRTGSRRNRR